MSIDRPNWPRRLPAKLPYPNRRTSYDWALYTPGEVFLLWSDAEFFTSVESVRSSLHDWCKRNGSSARTKAYRFDLGDETRACLAFEVTPLTDPLTIDEVTERWISAQLVSPGFPAPPTNSSEGTNQS